MTIGRHGVVTAEQARRKAAMVIASIKAGAEPGRAKTGSPSAGGPTIADLGERYLREHVEVRCKPTTAGAYRYTLTKYLLPEFGSMPLGVIGREDVAALHYRLHKTPNTANRVVETLSRLFYMAEAWGVVPEGENPYRFVKKYRSRSCERFLSEEEFRRLGRVLSEVGKRGQDVGERSGGSSAADADRVQAERDLDAPVGRRRSVGGRVEVEGRQDWNAVGGALAGSAEGAVRTAPEAEQPVGDCWT